MLERAEKILFSSTFQWPFVALSDLEKLQRGRNAQLCMWATEQILFSALQRGQFAAIFAHCLYFLCFTEPGRETDSVNGRQKRLHKPAVKILVSGFVLLYSQQRDFSPSQDNYSGMSQWINGRSWVGVLGNAFCIVITGEGGQWKKDWEVYILYKIFSQLTQEAQTDTNRYTHRLKTTAGLSDKHNTKYKWT